MLMSDADKMLEWKNYPETRQFAILSHDEIKKEDHYKWLEKNIQYFMVAEVAEKILGAIRIEGDEISIWVDKELWRHGVATKMLQRVAQTGMCARIVNGNIASFRLFIGVGFRPIVYNEDYGYYLLRK